MISLGNSIWLSVRLLDLGENCNNWENDSNFLSSLWLSKDLKQFSDPSQENYHTADKLPSGWAEMAEGLWGWDKGQTDCTAPGPHCPALHLSSTCPPSGRCHRVTSDPAPFVGKEVVLFMVRDLSRLPGHRFKRPPIHHTHKGILSNSHRHTHTHTQYTVISW